MGITSFPGSALLRSVAAAVFVTAALSVPVHAQTAAPKAAATLDVCENTATGKWRYSGVVALGGPVAAGTAAKVGYKVQNRIYDANYRTAYQAAATQVSPTAATVFGFATEAAPLTLGTMRGAATVTLTDPASGRITSFEVVAPETVCGCEPVKGCVRTQGYWGSKPGVVWPAPYSRDALFFASGLTLQQVLDAPVRGSGYLILAKQYIAAVLNYASGASAPPSVIDAIDEASDFFSSGTTPASCGPGECQEQIALAAILDAYNNGVYPGGPPPCPE